jgi:TPR repeat protein
MSNFDSNISIYKKAAHAGHAESQFRLALLFQEPHDWKPGIKAKSKAMQFIFRMVHCISPFIIKDDYESFKWMKSAALQGYPPAEYGLADMLYYGYGCLVNEADAIKWFKKSAEHGFVEAFYKLGKIFHGNVYHAGDSNLKHNLINPKYVEAFKWWIIAAQKGHTLAQFEIAQMYEYAGGVNQNFKEAANWYSKAAEKNHVESIYRLARLKEDGKTDGQADYCEAARLYRLALSLGYDTAGWYLLRLLQNNRVSPVNSEEAVSWKQASKRSSDNTRFIYSPLR